MRIELSNRKDKRYKAIFDNGIVVHFGLKNPKIGTYIDHGDNDIKAAYIARHSINENWNDPYLPGTLSRFILWGDSPDITTNIRQYKRLFKL